MVLKIEICQTDDKAHRSVTSSAARVPFRAVYREVFMKEVLPGRSRYIFAGGRRKTLELTPRSGCHFEKRSNGTTGCRISKNHYLCRL
jgi:hypothetical protein